MHHIISQLEDWHKDVKEYKVKVTYHTPRGQCRLSIHEKDGSLLGSRWLEEGEDIGQALMEEVNRMKNLLKRYEHAIAVLKNVHMGIYG